jgi:hypothetical protein
MLASQGAPQSCTAATCNRYPFWSTTDGRALPAVTGTPDFTPAGAHHGGSCALDDDVCATQTYRVVNLALSGVWAYVYRPDGTAVASWPLSATVVSSLALAPDLQVLAASGSTVADVVVSRVSDGSLVGSHSFNPPMNAP